MDIKPYDFPDSELLKVNEPAYRVMVWVPEFLSIVLGQSNSPEKSVIRENVERDRIPVYKRPSGGETVVISPNTVMISIVKGEKELRSPRVYFNNYSEKIIRALENLGVEGLSLKGISDICLGEKKILGSSIYRNKDLVLYHAVLNRAESVEVLERYLEHPPREPGYRGGRSHREFVTSLLAEGYNINNSDISTALKNELMN